MSKERLAWLTLVASLAILGLLVFSVPRALAWFLSQSSYSTSAILEIIDNGTVLVTRQGTNYEVNATQDMSIASGDGVRTDRSSRALLTFVDGSNIELRPGSTITILESETSRFNDDFSRFSVRLSAGRLNINIAPPITRKATFELLANDARIALDEGSYSADMGRQGVEVAVRLGKATLVTSGNPIKLAGGQQAMVSPAGISGPSPLGKDFITNGDFQSALDSWNWSNRDEEGQPGTVSIATENGAKVLRIKREGNGHAETYAVQKIERDVSDLPGLKLAIDFKLVTQSLAGGGVAGSEYPLHIRLRYRDVTGREWLWIKEFYYQNVDNNPVSSTSEMVPKDAWQHYEKSLLSGDISPRPIYLVELEIAASGHSYETLVEKVQLVGA